MEIQIKPNWTSDAYIPVSGVFSGILAQASKQKSFTSSTAFNINDILKIYQGGVGIHKHNWAICRVVLVNNLGGTYLVQVKVLSGKLFDGIAIKRIEAIYDDMTFYLDGMIDLQLSIRIYDLKEMKRSSAYTRTVEVPFTPNNDKIFSQLFNVNVSDGYNPKKKSDCWITDGGILISSGYIQIQEIDVPNKVYKCVFYGDNKNLFDDIGDNLITGNTSDTYDLDLSDWAHSKYASTIFQSWEGTEPYVYGLVFDDTNQHTLSSLQGTYSSWLGWVPQTLYYQFKPQVRAKALWDKIFDKWGYQYESDFINSDFFNKVVVMPQATPNAANGDYTIFYSGGATYSITTSVYNIIPVTTQLIDTFGGKYDTGTGKFTVPYSGYYSLSMVFYLYGAIASIPSYPTLQHAEPHRDRVDIVMKVDRGGGTIYEGSIYNKISTITQQSVQYITGTQSVPDPSNPGFSIIINTYGTYFVYSIDEIGSIQLLYQDLPIRFMTGDEVYFYIYTSNIDGIGSTTHTYFIKGGSNQYVIGCATDKDNITLDYLFEGIKQSDFMGDMFKMFNLYIKPDKINPKKFLIEPRDDFYKKGTTISDLEYDSSDWSTSYLIDLGAKKYTLTYKKGEDLANKTFQVENVDRVYGDAVVELDNDFYQDETKVELNAVPTQFRWLNSLISFPTFEGAGVKNTLRYYLYSGTASVGLTFSYILWDNGTQSSIYNMSYYPAFGNYEVYNNPLSQSTLFATRYNTEVKEQSLYYTYYENEIETYAEPTSHIITLKVRMNTRIYNAIDFDDIFYFELNGNGQYYTLLSIDGYIPGEECLATLKFLTYYDFQAEKPKKTRSYVKGIPANLNYMDAEMSPIGYIDGVLPSSGGNIIRNAVNGIAAGSDIVMVGDNQNVIAIGQNIIVDEGISKAGVLSGVNLRVGAPNVFSIGGSNKDLMEVDSIYLNDHYARWDPYVYDAITNPTAGIMAMGTDTDIVWRDESGKWKQLNSYIIEDDLSDNLLIATASWNNIFQVTLDPVGTWYMTANITAGLSNGYVGPTEVSISGTQNKLNKSFTLAHAVTTHQFFVNGQLMTYGADYTISGTTLTMIEIPPDTSDVLRIFTTGGGNQLFYIRITSGASTIASGVLISPEYGINTLSLSAVLENLTATASTIEVDIYGTNTDGQYVYKDYSHFIAHRLY